MAKSVSRMILLVLAAVSSVSMAGSIWAKKSLSTKSIYADETARQIGDLLTIIINESSKVDNEVSRDLSNASNRSLDFNGNNNYIEHLIPSTPTIKIGATGSRSLNGSSDFEDKRNIVDRMTVVVQDVLPNGALVVVGKRVRDVAGDKQTILVSGLVRPSDVLFDNTILSEQVANFQLMTINEGVSEDYNKPGWLGQFMDAIWPF